MATTSFPRLALPASAHRMPAFQGGDELALQPIIVLAVGELEDEADRVVALATPEPFHAVGQWYRDFDQVADRVVVAALQGDRSK